MRVTISVKSKSDIEAATVALNHFIREKKPDDGTSTSWGIGITGNHYFSVSEKKNGSYSVIQSGCKATGE